MKNEPGNVNKKGWSRVSSFREGMSGLARTFSNTANKVQGCLRQPIFNDCTASMRRLIRKEGEGGYRADEEGTNAGCARDENRGARFQVENEMELNDS